MAAKKTKTKPKKKATKKKAVAKKAVKKKAVAKKASSKKKATKKKAVAKKAAGKKKAVAKKASSKKKATKKSVKTATKKSVAIKKSPTKKALKKTVANKAVKSPKKKTVTKPKKIEFKIPASAKWLKDSAWLDNQKKQLTEMRASYTSSAEKLASEAAALMDDRDPGDVQFDEESGEGDTIAVERDRGMALSAQARQAVEEIDKAFERLSKGVYGLCTSGGDVVPKARLEYMPEAAVCVKHKTSMFD